MKSAPGFAAALVLLFIACGPPSPAPTMPVWADATGSNTKLASGGVGARLDGIGEAVDVDSTHPEIAMAQYQESIHQTDAGYAYVTTRYITVTTGMAGATTLTLYRRGTTTVLATVPVEVVDTAQIGLATGRALLVSQKMWLHPTRLSSSGEPLLGTGGISCSVTGSLSGTADCFVAGDMTGDGTVTATAGNVSSTLLLTVVPYSGVTSITAGPLQTMTRDLLQPMTQETIGTITLTAQTALGPAFGGYFSCTIDGKTECVLPNDSPSDTPGDAITLLSCGAGTHTLACTLVNTSLSLTTVVSL